VDGGDGLGWWRVEAAVGELQLEFADLGLEVFPH
jgi:hypothetical protein